MNMRVMSNSGGWANSYQPAPLAPDYSSMANWGGPNQVMPQAQLPMLDNINGYAPVVDLSTAASPDTIAGISLNQPGFMDKMLGYRGADGTQFNGWGGMALGAANGIMSGFMGMKQLGVAKQQLAEGKRQFNLNFGAQQKLTNSRLEDRQAARVAAGGSAYQSVGEYMKKNGI